MLKTCFKIHKYFFYDFVVDYGRFRSELPLEEKVFIHAELTPMAKLKKPIVATTKVGLVKVQISTAVDDHPGGTPPKYKTHSTKASRTAFSLVIALCQINTNNI